MTKIVNGRPLHIEQFSSVTQASAELPEALLLRFINAAWANVQMIKRIDAEREVRREKR